MTVLEAPAILGVSGARHTPEPEGPTWWAIRKGGAWRVGCKHCDRVVAFVPRTNTWRHVR